MTSATCMSLLPASSCCSALASSLCPGHVCPYPCLDPTAGPSLPHLLLHQAIMKSAAWSTSCCTVSIPSAEHDVALQRLWLPAACCKPQLTFMVVLVSDDDPALGTVSCVCVCVRHMLERCQACVRADMPGRQPNKLVASKLSALLSEQVTHVHDPLSDSQTTCRLPTAHRLLAATVSTYTPYVRPGMSITACVPHSWYTLHGGLDPWVLYMYK